MSGMRDVISMESTLMLYAVCLVLRFALLIDSHLSVDLKSNSKFRVELLAEASNTTNIVL
jgi:hypothetical protein